MDELGFDLKDEDARDRIEILFWKVTQRLLALGFSVILESGFWLRSDRDEKRQGARALGARVELWYLDVPLEQRWSRIRKRNEGPMWRAAPIEREQLERWSRYFETPSTSELELFNRH